MVINFMVNSFRGPDRADTARDGGSQEQRLDTVDMLFADNASSYMNLDRDAAKDVLARAITLDQVHTDDLAGLSLRWDVEP